MQALDGLNNGINEQNTEVSLPYLHARTSAWQNGQKPTKADAQPRIILRDAFRAGVVSPEAVCAEIKSTWDNPDRALARLIYNNLSSPACAKLPFEAATTNAQWLMDLIAQLPTPSVRKSTFEQVP